MQTKRVLFVFFIHGILTLSGCVTVPQERISAPIEAGELEEHVRFLAQRGLRGRKTGTHQAKIVRRYLTERLAQYGLMPWGQAEGFEQDFRIGKNVIGILPGSDPNLTNEIVLVSAHYDHIGTGFFKTYHGACDNASGVAALLEIAERMSRAKPKPRRSICFALFDAEEIGCLGSFAFTCREDYSDSKIAAVINIDLLGRDFLEVVDNSLLAVGSERFPALCDHIEQAGQDPNLKILHFETELVGPVGDHVAFLSPRRPVLFFTCGLYRDYHQPSDTAEKLDYDKIRREAAVVYDTLDYLANADEIEKASEIDPPVPQTLQSLGYVLEEVERNKKETFRFDPNELQILQSVRTQVTAALEKSPPLTAAQRMRLERKILKKLLPLFKDFFPEMAQNAELFMQVGEWFALYPQEFTDGYRDIIRQGLAQKPSLFKKAVFAYRNEPEPTDRDWAAVCEPNGLFLACVKPSFEAEAGYSIIGPKGLILSLGFQIDLFRGRADEAIDYIYLKMMEDHFAIPGNDEEVSPPDPDTFAVLMAGAAELIRDPNSGDSIWNRIYLNMPSCDTDSAGRPLIDICFDPGDPNTLFTQWLPALCVSSNFSLAQEAVQASVRFQGDDIAPLLRSLLTDPNNSPQIRAAAAASLSLCRSRDNLMALVRVLDDPTICREWKPQMILTKDFPLREHPLLKPILPSFKEWLQTRKARTLGQMAAEKLEKATDRNFGRNRKRWEKWINKHYPE